jgi:hypothetical protein
MSSHQSAFPRIEAGLHNQQKSDAGRVSLSLFPLLHSLSLSLSPSLSLPLSSLSLSLVLLTPSFPLSLSLFPLLHSLSLSLPHSLPLPFSLPLFSHSLSLFPAFPLSLCLSLFPLPFSLSLPTFLPLFFSFPFPGNYLLNKSAVWMFILRRNSFLGNRIDLFSIPGFRLHLILALQRPTQDPTHGRVETSISPSGNFNCKLQL